MRNKKTPKGPLTAQQRQQMSRLARRAFNYDVTSADGRREFMADTLRKAAQQTYTRYRIGSYGGNECALFERMYTGSVMPGQHNRDAYHHRLLMHGPKGACEARLNSLVKANVTRTKRNNEVRLQMFFDDVRRGFYDELIGKSQKAPLPEGYQPKQRTLNATQRGVLEFLESQGGKAYVIDLPGMITRIRTSNGGVSTTIRPGQARDLTNMIQLGLVYVDTGFVGPKGTRVSLTGNGKQYVQKYLTKSAKTAEPGTVADAMQKIDRGQVVKVKTPAGYVTARRGDSPHLNMPGQQSKYYVWRGQSATGRAMFTFTSRGELESWLNSVIGNQKAAKATDIKVGDAVVVPNGAAAPYGEMGYAGFVGMVMAIQGNRAKVKPVRAPMVGKWRVYTVPLNVLRIAPGWVGHG